MLRFYFCEGVVWICSDEWLKTRRIWSNSEGRWQVTLLPQRSIYNHLRSRREIDLYMCFLERSVMCHGKSSRPRKYWAGGRDTSVTDPKTMTLIVSWLWQKKGIRSQDTGLSLEKKCHPSEKCHHFRHPLFRGIKSLQWLQRRSWWKQKKPTNRRVNHLQKILI